MVLLTTAVWSCLLFTGVEVATNRAAPGTDVNRVQVQTKREELVRLFNASVALNEGFKRVAGTIPLVEHQERRRLLEKHEEELLIPAISTAVQLLSKERDVELARVLLATVVSYENSANEEFAYQLGELYLSNPALLEEAVLLFSLRDQEYLLDKVEWGLANVAHERGKGDPMFASASDRLRAYRDRLLKTR